MASLTPYESLIHSASQLSGIEVLDDLYEDKVTRASVFLASNVDAMNTARDQLVRGCTIPLRFEKSFLPDHSDDFTHIRNLARAFKMQLLLDKSRGNHSTAARVGIDILTLANAARRGGLVMDMLTSLIIEGIAFDGLRKLRHKLPPSDAQFLTCELDRLEKDREAYVDIAKRDREWEVAVGYADESVDMSFWEMSDPNECGLDEEQQVELRDLVRHLANLPEDQKTLLHIDLDRRMIALSRLLRVDLFLRCELATNGSYPIRLLPETLPNAGSAIDPFTGTEFIYRRVSSGSFVLYSPGPTRIDHGGQFGPWTSVSVGDADYCLDSEDYSDDNCVLRHNATRPRLLSAIVRLWRRWKPNWQGNATEQSDEHDRELPR